MARTNHTAALLRVIPTLSALGDRPLARLARLATEVTFPPGRALVRQGERGTEAFIVIEGEALVQRDGELVARVGRGAFIGEIALLDGLPRTATVTAITPMRALALGAQDFRRFVDDAEGARSVAIGLAGRLRGAATAQPAQ